MAFQRVDERRGLPELGEHYELQGSAWCLWRCTKQWLPGFRICSSSAVSVECSCLFATSRLWECSVWAVLLCHALHGIKQSRPCSVFPRLCDLLSCHRISCPFSYLPLLFIIRFEFSYLADSSSTCPDTPYGTEGLQFIRNGSPWAWGWSAWGPLPCQSTWVTFKDERHRFVVPLFDCDLKNTHGERCVLDNWNCAWPEELIALLTFPSSGKTPNANGL